MALTQQAGKSRLTEEKTQSLRPKRDKNSLYGQQKIGLRSI